MNKSFIEYHISLVSYENLIDRDKKQNGVELNLCLANPGDKWRLRDKKSKNYYENYQGAKFFEIKHLKKEFPYGYAFRRKFVGYPKFHGRVLIELGDLIALKDYFENEYNFSEVVTLKSINNYFVDSHYNPEKGHYEIDNELMMAFNHGKRLDLDRTDGMPPEKDQPLTILQIVELLRELEDKNPKFKVQSVREINSLRCRTNGVSVLLAGYKEKIHRIINQFTMAIGEPVTNWKGGHRFVNWECLVAVGGVNGFNNRYITGINWRGGWKTTSVNEWEKKERLKWI